MAKKSSINPQKHVKIEQVKLEFLREIAIVVGGKSAGDLVNVLLNKKNVNEFFIAKKLNFTINQTRNVLYKLSDEGLVSSIRKKDKKKGWYTYFWTFNEDKALLLFTKHLSKEIEQLENQLKSRQTKQYYICRVCNFELTEDKALLHNFICPECGEVYELNQSDKPVKDINLSIGKLRAKLKIISEELKIIEHDNLKKIERENNRLAREKNKIKIKALKQRRAVKLANKKQTKIKTKKISKKIKKKSFKKISKKLIKRVKKKVKNIRKKKKR